MDGLFDRRKLGVIPCFTPLKNTKSSEGLSITNATTSI